jgi:hypothetical protein
MTDVWPKLINEKIGWKKEIILINFCWSPLESNAQFLVGFSFGDPLTNRKSMMLFLLLILQLESFWNINIWIVKPFSFQTNKYFNKSCWFFNCRYHIWIIKKCIIFNNQSKTQKEYILVLGGYPFWGLLYTTLNV